LYLARGEKNGELKGREIETNWIGLFEN